MNGMAAQTFHSEEERYGCLKLCSQEKHLEVQEWLVAGREMGLTCGKKKI